MFFSHLPIRQKLIMGILLTSGAVLMLTVAAFVTYEVITIRKGTVEGYRTRAVIIAANSTAALAFQNQADAMGVLSALKTDSRIVMACIYDNQGKVFVKYPADTPTPLLPPQTGESGYRAGHLDIFYPIIQGDRKLGTVYIQTNLSNLTDRYHAYAWLVLFIFISCIFLAYFLSKLLEKRISLPILALAETAKAVSRRQDFSVRAKKFGDDELGSLTDAFNQMLAEIQEQHKAIKKLNTGLEQRIFERTAELELTNQEVQEANEKLKELDKLKTDFFSNVSHELRTPLTLILAPVESLLIAPEVSASRRETLQIIHNNASRLLQMVNGLLDFSKVAAKKMEAKREPINILDLTRSIAWDFKGLVKQKNIEMGLSLNAGHPVVEMDRYLYERVLFNLISNAVKFTPKDGRINIDLYAIDDGLTLTVTDTGIGISEENQKNLFEKFHQVEGSATRRFEGTGLGLAMCKEFAQLLEGTVAVKSGVGKGSTFTLTCRAPQAKEKPAFINPAGNKPPAPLVEKLTGVKASADAQIDRPKVLVAEDNPEMSEFVESLLSSFCAVRVAPNGVEALSLVRRWRPDLVLSDVMMPLMDGIQLTKEIKSDKEISTTPVVLLTAMTDRESLMAGWQVGADDYLFKPFHPKELEARVKSLLAAIEWRRKGEAYRRQRDALEHFTHIASHDLREPLRKIINFIQLFQNSQKNLDKDAQFYLQTISDSSVRMYRLLNILMDYSRLDRKDSPFEKVDLSKMVESVAESLNEEIQVTGARITVGLLPEITVIKEQMSLVFQNLISNSLKYRKDGVLPQIRVEAVKKEFEWVFSISDNGIGFDPSQNEKIFIMFERLHGNEQYPGDGMGLAICRKIIENHGGRIWADSNPGQGATFYFTLPLEQESLVV